MLNSPGTRSSLPGLLGLLLVRSRIVVIGIIIHHLTVATVVVAVVIALEGGPVALHLVLEVLRVDVAARGVAELGRHLEPLLALPLGLEDGQDLAVAAAPRLVRREPAPRRVQVAEDVEPGVVGQVVLAARGGFGGGFLVVWLIVAAGSRGGLGRCLGGSRGGGGLVSIAVVVFVDADRSSVSAAVVAESLLGRGRGSTAIRAVLWLDGWNSTGGGGGGSSSIGRVGGSASGGNNRWGSVRRVVGKPALVETLAEPVHLLALREGQRGQRHRGEVREHSLGVRRLLPALGGDALKIIRCVYFAGKEGKRQKKGK
ncbi:hypothetical protein PG990_000299 [Apiospora arundinis]